MSKREVFRGLIRSEDGRRFRRRCRIQLENEAARVWVRFRSRRSRPRQTCPSVGARRALLVRIEYQRTCRWASRWLNWRKTLSARHSYIDLCSLEFSRILYSVLTIHSKSVSLFRQLKTSLWPLRVTLAGPFWRATLYQSKTVYSRLSFLLRRL